MVPGKRLRNLGGTFRLCYISVEVNVAHTQILSLLDFILFSFLSFVERSEDLSLIADSEFLILPFFCHTFLSLQRL